MVTDDECLLLVLMKEHYHHLRYMLRIGLPKLLNSKQHIEDLILTLNVRAQSSLCIGPAGSSWDQSKKY